MHAVHAEPGALFVMIQMLGNPGILSRASCYRLHERMHVDCLLLLCFLAKQSALNCVHTQHQCVVCIHLRHLHIVLFTVPRRF